MTVIPRSVGVPPLSDANFEQVLMTNAMMMQQQQQQSQRPAVGVIVPPLQQQHQQQQQSQLSFTSLLAMGEDDGRINPLAGMGLSDEHYNMILQNLVNGERLMGMGMDGMVGGGVVGNTAGGGGGGGSGSGMKRTIDDAGGGGGDERGGKRSRFEVIE